MTNPAHRPRGSGSSLIRIARRSDLSFDRNGEHTQNVNAGYFLFIGRALWQQIDCPLRITLTENSITPGDDYAVVNTAQNGQPRCSVGRERIETLGLTEGEYPATIDGSTIRFK